ncbi:Transmembrane efflux protein OS=Streptomyces glaucescens OX=1907 GN=SGLAU_27895 PE=4 SV=1 [Streptomyces glaucescens]
MHALAALSESPAGPRVRASPWRPSPGWAFVRHERRARSPLLPAAVRGPAAIRSALGLLVTASATLHGALFSCVYLLQDTFGLDPLRSALRSLPLAVLIIAAAPVCAVLLRRAGARRTTTAAALVLAGHRGAVRRVRHAHPVPVGFALVGAGFAR